MNGPTHIAFPFPNSLHTQTRWDIETGPGELKSRKEKPPGEANSPWVFPREFSAFRRFPRRLHLVVACFVHLLGVCFFFSSFCLLDNFWLLWHLLVCLWHAMFEHSYTSTATNFSFCWGCPVAIVRFRWQWSTKCTHSKQSRTFAHFTSMHS